MVTCLRNFMSMKLFLMSSKMMQSCATNYQFELLARSDVSGVTSAASEAANIMA